MLNTPALMARIAALEEQLERLSHLYDIQTVPPLNQDSTAGIGTVFSIDEPVLAENISEIIINEGLLPSGEAYDRVVKIVDGTLVAGKYDILVQDRTSAAWADGATAWGIDLAVATSLTADAEYPALISRDSSGSPVTEVGGPTYICLQAANGNLLTDTAYWLPQVGTTTAWSGATTYVAGNVVTDTGDTYICVLGHTNHAPPNSTYWTLLPSGITSRGGWTVVTEYAVGDSVQEERSLYAFRSVAGSGITSVNGSTTAAQQIAVGDAGSDLNIATTAAAYDNAKTYSAGWVVLSSGSTYRFINATPSAGHSPPNATYWEDVTGQGLSVVNVPRIASINGDATAAQLITSTSDTVKISQPSAGTTNLEVPSGCDRFRSSGTTLTTTWTCPTSVTSVFVQAFGPSGVYPDSASTGFWKAGGGGAYASSTLTVVPGRVYDVEVFPAFIGSVGYAKIAYSGTDLVKAVGGNRDVGGDYSACVGTEKVSGGDGGGDASTNSTGSGTGITGSGGGGGAGQAIPGYSGEAYTADVNVRAGRGGFGYSNGFSGEFNSSTSTTFGGDQPGGGHGAYYGGGAAPNGRGLGELRITWGIGSAIKGVKGQVALISDPASGIRVRNTVQSSTDLDSALQITLDIPVTTSKGGTGRTTLDSGQLLAGAGTSAVDSLSSTRVVGETIELKIGSDSWIAFSEGSF